MSPVNCKGIKVLGILGSPFEDGLTSKVLDNALYGAQLAGAYTQKLFVPMDIGHHEGERPEHLPLKERLALLPKRGQLPYILRLMLEFDAFIFATSTMLFDASTRLMTLLCYAITHADKPEQPLHGKVAATLAVCEEDGGQRAIDSIMTALRHLGFFMPAFADLYFNKNAYHMSECDWQRKHQPLLGFNVAQLAAVLREHPGINWYNLGLPLMHQFPSMTTRQAA